MMTESKETPSVGLGKLLTVFHGRVDAVVLAVEKPASRWFRTRAVRKSRIKNSSQFFYNDRSFGKGARLEIRVYASSLYIHMMIFGEVRLGTVRSVRVAVELSIIKALGG